MKKIITLILVMLTAYCCNAQKLNQDTLAKYSKKQEQTIVFNRIATDIHLTSDQNAKFNEISYTYADKAISVLKNTKSAPCDKLTVLKQILKDYSAQIKQVLSSEQFSMLKSEREKYHFGRRFVTFND